MNAEAKVCGARPHSRVLLLHGALRELAWDSHWKGTPSLTPPLGLMYLGGPLLRAGHAVSFVDLNVDRMDEAAFRALVAAQDFVLVTVYADTLKSIVPLLGLIRSANPNVRILCGGPYCTFSEERFPGADVTVFGEAEQHIVQILRCLSEGRDLGEFSGLAFRRNGEWVRSPGILQAGNLDESVHASWELARNKDYGHLFGVRVKGIVLMMTSRGCPHRCTYCTHKGVLPYRERSVENVLAELRLWNERGYRFAVFDDENFLMNRPRALEILRRMRAEGIRLRLMIQGRVDSADLGFYRELRRHGVFLIMFGIENANQDVLDFYHKAATVDAARRAIRIADQAGLLSLGFFILGSHLENENHHRANLRFVLEEPLDYLNINILGYYRGSALWSWARERNLVENDDVVVYANEGISRHSFQQWQRRKQEILDAFYARPLWVLRLVWKSLRLGIFGALVNVLWNARRDLLVMVRSPFIEDSGEQVRIKAAERSIA